MRVVVSVILCLSFTLLTPNEILACLCKPEPVRQKIKRLQRESAAIFEGTVKSVTKDNLRYRATLTVKKLWKYKATEEITVKTEGGCMAWFEVGRSYLVYAVKDDLGEFKTDVCMRTRLVEYASEDLKRLGKPNVVYDASKAVSKLQNKRTILSMVQNGTRFGKVRPRRRSNNPS